MPTGVGCPPSRASGRAGSATTSPSTASRSSETRRTTSSAPDAAARWRSPSRPASTRSTSWRRASPTCSSAISPTSSASWRVWPTARHDAVARLGVAATAGGRDHLPRAGRLARLIGERRGLSEPGDLDARVLQLVAPVDRRENRGDALERSGVAQDADVDRTKAHRAPELADGILGGGIAAAEEQIALDRALSL